ncbi:hypothetical protein Tco_0279442, partial [Tanacetum coccineum]
LDFFWLWLPAFVYSSVLVLTDMCILHLSRGSNAPTKVLRKDHDAARVEHSARGGKSLADMSVDTELAIHIQETQEPHIATQSVSDPDPFSYAKP